MSPTYHNTPRRVEPTPPPDEFPPLNQDEEEEEEEEEETDEDEALDELQEIEVIPEEEEADFEIPPLDDIIPWSGPRRKPRQPPVYDPVRTAEGINIVFLENILKSYYAMKGLIEDVLVQSYTESQMDTLSPSQRNNVTAVNVIAIVHGKQEVYHMVIKTLTTSQPVRALCAAHFFDRREAGLYAEILEDINLFQRQQVQDPNACIEIPSPTCFFARYKAPCRGNCLGEDYSIPPDESVVVLENIKYQGYTQTHVDKGLSLQQVRTVLEGISRLHGTSLAMKERSGIPLHFSYKYLLCLTEAIQCILGLFDRNMPLLFPLFDTYGLTGIYSKVMDLRPHLDLLVERLLRAPEPLVVLGHMNLWAHNILFKGETECVFVDWQMITRARPTFDLAFLLATSVDTNMRRNDIGELLGVYYMNLSTYSLKFGLDLHADCHYTRDDLWKDFRCCQLLTMFFFIGKKNDLLNSQDTQARFIDFMNDLDSQKLLRPDGIDLYMPEWVQWIPQPRVKPKGLCPIDSEDPPGEGDNDPFRRIFPMDQLREP